MKKLFFTLITTFAVLFAVESTTGFVDSDRIFNEYQATTAANIELNDFVKTQRDSAAILRQQIDNLKTELNDQKLMLSEEARLRKLDEIEAQTKIYNAFLEEYFGDGGKVEQKNDVLMAPLLKKINDAVSKIAQQEGFAVVFDLSENVFYASSDLDLTDLVIDELNLEYGPQILPTGELKKQVAIFPFREENTEATKADLGERCQDELYKIVNAFSKFEFISKGSVKSEMIKRHVGLNINDSQAYAIGVYFQCEYIIVGKVTKQAAKIDYTISLKDVEKNQEIDSRVTVVTDEIKLAESLNNDLRALIAKVQ
jgi:Skp family chaperone for outer membrane proteins/TolB-like protein